MIEIRRIINHHTDELKLFQSGGGFVQNECDFEDSGSNYEPSSNGSSPVIGWVSPLIFN